MLSSPASVETNRAPMPTGERLLDPTEHSMGNDDTVQRSCSDYLSFLSDHIPCLVFARSQSRSWSPDLSRHPKDTGDYWDSSWSRHEIKEHAMVSKENLSLSLVCSTQSLCCHCNSLPIREWNPLRVCVH